MDQDIDKIIAERYNGLPEKMQVFLVKPTVRSSIKIIGEKHHLPPDKLVRLENKTMLVLLAFEHKNTFEERLIEHLLVPGSVAASIARDIDTTVFSEIKDELDAIYADRAKADNEESHKEYVRDTAPAYRETLGEPPVVPPPSYSQPLTNTDRYREEPT